MSDTTNTANQDGTFDIFNLGSAPVVDPFATAESVQPQAIADEKPPVQQEQAAPPQTAQPQPAPLQTAQPQTEAKAQAAAPAEVPENPLAAAAAKAEEKQAVVTAESLFAKPPVFEYGGASEDIADTSKTFEELRIEKAADFPELEDGKRVSWTMEYGKIVKNVATPAKTTVSKLKSEIENSKEFIEALKKAKDKDIVCKVKPKITAQSKGIASYKGIFPAMEEAEASGKAIRILPARDGRVYEIRCNEAGTFTARAVNVRELSEISAGFVPALPPVPFPLFAQVISFFRSFMQNGHEAEALVHVYWDKAERQYKIVPPMQSVSKAYISVVTPPDEALDAQRYIHVADIHSHNSMPAFFSRTDDRDELATRVYIVVGLLDQSAPAIAARISVGGRFVPIDARQAVEIPTMIITSSACDGNLNPEFMDQRFELSDDPGFPSEWTAAVNVTEPSRREARQVDIDIAEPGWLRLFLRKWGWPA